MKKIFPLALTSLVFLHGYLNPDINLVNANQESANQVTEPQEGHIAKLGFLVGNWGGSGTVYSTNGSQSAYQDTEFVRFDLDKKLLLINARGEQPTGEIYYQLHTVIYYDKKAEHYWYTPFTGNTDSGKPSSLACNLIEQRLLCHNQAKNYRLTFQRLSDGKWNEYGEILSDGKWTKSFETILSAVDD